MTRPENQAFLFLIQAINERHNEVAFSCFSSAKTDITNKFINSLRGMSGWAGAIIPAMLLVIPVILLGWLGGMLVNYVSDVYPIKRKLIAPVCLKCGERQPFINYFLWPRQCTHCGMRRKIRTWIVEGSAILIAVWLWDQGSLVLGFFPGFLVLAYFGIVAVIDLEHRLIPHPISLVGSVIGLVIGTWQHGLVPTLLGCLAGFVTMLVLFLFGELFVKIVIRRRRPDFEDTALGFGDVILGGVLGLFVGWPGIVLALIAGILIGGVGVILYLIVRLALGRYRSFDFVPYGPFLLAGAFFALFYKELLLTLLN